MSTRGRFLRLKRRELLIGAVALSLGVAVTILAVTVMSRFQPTELPLAPGSGETSDRLTIAWLPATVTRWKPQIEHYAAAYKVDPNLIAIIMTVESGGDPHANSGVAKGLMQITDPTGADIAHRILAVKRQTYDLYDPETSIEFGAAYLRYLANEVGDSTQGPSWDETVILTAAGYNGGLTASQQYQLHGWQGLSDYDQQTLTYARYVHVMWQERNDPLSFAYRYWYDTGNGQRLVNQAATATLPSK